MRKLKSSHNMTKLLPTILLKILELEANVPSRATFNHRILSYQAPNLQIQSKEPCKIYYISCKNLEYRNIKIDYMDTSMGIRYRSHDKVQTDIATITVT